VNALDALSDAPSAGSLDVVDTLLRDREKTFEAIAEERDLSTLARSLLLSVIAGAALFGMALGAFRGGLQIAYAGLKLPLVLLLTTAACAPALTAVGSALGRKAVFRRDLALVLAALARTSLTLGALTPVVLLGVVLEVDYHRMLLLVVGACGLAGLVGLVHFCRGLRYLDQRAVLSTSLVLLAVFGLVGSQMSWTLRPFLVRPRTDQAPFVRQVEGDFADAVLRSGRSAAGVYDRALEGEE
jgi:hypothetical protein